MTMEQGTFAVTNVLLCTGKLEDNLVHQVSTWTTREDPGFGVFCNNKLAT
ncbi:hypothetical protein SETIT_4G132800v2 [Setaria italica]|uniref:Uncharacterized protein n=2 Tax=Setaria TaxID=4554 RepID=A0A368QUB0_SETIT|nr:hypothetical protein SETIT_4G132800v2 [Setaria italica]TKW21110.1 hypothetical protein SEVIR_4G184300v2 [Setaria viridis]